MIFRVLNFDLAGNLRKFAPRLEEIEEEEGRREEERKVINSSVEEEEEEEEVGSGKRMMGSFHSSASSGSSTLDMMGRVVREGNSKEERRGRSKHQVKYSFSHFPSPSSYSYPSYPSYPTPSPLFIQLKTIFLLFRVLTLASQRDQFRV